MRRAKNLTQEQLGLLMPAKSRKQQKLLFAKFGEQWVKAHHFDKIENKPKRSAAGASKRKKK
jgi:hypothetical protein